MTIQINTHANANGQGSAPITQDTEYYILCPQRATEVPGLITHLISRDICERRQAENYHKCPTCIRAAIYRARNGAAGTAAGSAASRGSPGTGTDS